MQDKDPLTNRIIGCAIEVHRTLGPGLERALLDPFALTGKAAIALFEELVATAVISCPGG